jgi:hypothetical protein
MRYQASPKEKRHIKDAGQRFNRALALATLCVRQDRRLTGLDRIREPLAYKAALRATGYEDARFVVPTAAGRPHAGINAIVAEVFDRAVAAAGGVQQ